MSLFHGPSPLDRLLSADPEVRQRLLAVIESLNSTGLPYVLTGDCAIAFWLSQVDQSASTKNRVLHVLIRREDWDRVRTAIESAGFTHAASAREVVFVNSADPQTREAVYVEFANERIHPTDAAVNPDVIESEPADRFSVLTLDALVRTKLISFSDKDRADLQFLTRAGLIDRNWPARFPPQSAERLQTLLDKPAE